MNFFKFHIGDYEAATAHLSWDEDAAYNRLMRVYYRRQAGIPDADKYRLIRALSRAQKAACDRVLTEFFTRDGDMWRNKRCDEEIAKYLEDGEDRVARNQNERDRQRRHRDRRKDLFSALREKGVIPKWDTPVTELETLLSRSNNVTCNAPVTHQQRLTTNQNQIPEPDTRSQNQIFKTDLDVAESPTRGREVNVKTVLKNIPEEQNQDQDQVERNRRIALALASGDSELAKEIRAGRA